jgi:subtilase family protein
MHFDLKSDVHASDELFAGAVTDDVDVFDVIPLTDEFAAFETSEVSISRLDGRTDVYPTFELFSDGETEGDGASVDNVRVLCRDQTYLDSIVNANNYADAGAGSYMRISGTSMATPHVSGVAALVRAQVPDATAPQVISAIKRGGRTSTALLGRTTSGKLVDALGAIDAAVATETPTVTTPQPTVPVPSLPVKQKATRPGPAGFASRYRVDRRGQITIRIVGDPRVRGTFTLRAGTPRRVILRASFRTSRRGTAVMLDRLNRAGRRLLRRGGGRLRAGVRVVLTNAAGLKSVTTQKPVVLAMRR